jgi:hypothetical protein
MHITYTSDKHPEKQHDVEFEQQDIPLLSEVGYDFGDLSEDAAAVMLVVLVVGRRIMTVLHGMSNKSQCLRWRPDLSVTGCINRLAT